MNQPHSEPANQTPPATGEKLATDSRVLERVLLETATTADALEVGASEWKSLLAVARRHLDQPVSSERVLFEMVETLLRPSFTNHKISAREWQPMIERIANTLSEDQPSFERIESLWKRLCEAAR